MNLPRRLVLLLVGVVALVAVLFVNFLVSVQVGGLCGVEYGLEPGSLRGRTYCALFQNPDDRVVVLGAAVLYGPSIVVLAGGAASTVVGAWGWLRRTVVVSFGWLAAIVVAGYLLPG